jgi:cytidine deaminase
LSLAANDLGRGSESLSTARQGDYDLLALTADPPSSRPTGDPLVEAARSAALRAYAPYSRFSVGCAIESLDGEIAIGSNMENACYRLGVCAEISALTAAQQAFGLDRIARIAVSGGHVGPDGTLSGGSLVTSCGGCRQSILEAAHVSGRDLEVVSSNGDGTEVTTHLISELIPFGFGPANLADAAD